MLKVYDTWTRAATVFCTLVAVAMLSGCGIGFFVRTPEECPSPHWAANKAEATQLRGTPSRVTANGENEETWTYTTNANRWCGIMPVVVVPVPLLLPLCDEYDRVVFQHDVPLASFQTRIKAGGFYLGPGRLVVAEHTYGCSETPALSSTAETVDCVVNGETRVVAHGQCSPQPLGGDD